MYMKYIVFVNLSGTHALNHLYSRESSKEGRCRNLSGKVSEKRDLACIIKKHNKNAPRLKCYNFRTVNATVFLFSALHNTPFLYDKLHFGILNMLHASVAMSDTPWGSNSPYLSAGNLNSFQN